MTLSDRTTTDEALTAGRDAFARHAGQEAFDLLSTADAQDRLPPQDLERLAEAAMWTQRMDQCLDAYERAYAAYIGAGNSRRAAYVAVSLCREHSGRLALSVAQGWLSRAARLLESQPESAEHGYLAYMQYHVHLNAGDLDHALQKGKEAFEIGTRFADRDLQALGMEAQGQTLVAKGQASEGLALLDEAAAAAVAGELTVRSSAMIYCTMVGTCRGLYDYGRAGEWIDAARRWCDDASLSYYPGTCRVNRAEIRRLRGAYAEAEKDAQLARDELRPFPALAREALYELGEIRLRTGDLAKAEEAFRQAHELGRDPQPGLALVRLAQGDVEAAFAMINPSLAEQTWERLGRARLLPAQVQIAIAAQDLPTARAAAEEMEAIAATYGTAVLRAMAFCTRGELQLAAGETRPALEPLRHGLRLWQEIDAPYDGARARLLIAAAYRASGAEGSAAL